MTATAPLKPGSYTYLGIDPGVKNCAMVAFNPNRGIVLTWKPPDKEIPGGVRRLSYLMHHIKGQLGAISEQGTIVRIAMEGYSMFERFGQHAAGEVGGAIKLALVTWFGLDNPIGYPILVQPQQLKKFAIGSGNAKKSLMTKEVLKRWGVDFDDDNLADAYALARVAYAQAAEPDMPVFQLEVIKALKGRTEWHPTLSTPEIAAPSGKTKRASSSSSAGPATRPSSPGRSLVRFKTASGSDSGPSVPRRLIRP